MNCCNAQYDLVPSRVDVVHHELIQDMKVFHDWNTFCLAEFYDLLHEFKSSLVENYHLGILWLWLRKYMQLASYLKTSINRY